MEWFDVKHGWLQKKIPDVCVKECSGSGDVGKNVEYWVHRLNFEVPEHLAKAYLQEFGAWEDLDIAPRQLLAERVLWLACCDIAEDGEWFGLVH